jgi:tetratricopeptide (TPR) repeat protein
VRIAVTLVDAGDGAQVWGERFDDALVDIFALQDKVALGVAGAVLPAIRGSEARRLSRRPTENMGSYDLYLHAWSLYRAVNRPEALRALELLEQALALDPYFEQALGMAAAVCGQILVSGWSDDPGDVRRRCNDFIDRALRAGGEDEVVLGNVSLGLTYGVGDIDRAIPLIDRAVAQNPGYAVNWLNSGIIRMLSGDLDTALEHLETAARLDPISVVNSTRNVIAQVLYLQGRFPEALAILQQSSLRTWTYHLMLALLLARLGQADKAQAALARCRELSPFPASGIAYTFHRPEHRRMFLDGVALAEGRTPA